MTKSRLSIHAIPHHNPDAIVNYARELQPPVILIVNPDVEFISRCYQVSPASIFSLRNHALSEQKGDVYANAAGTGDRHAREMVEWCDRFYEQARQRNLPMPPIENVILPGINEPHVNTDAEIASVVTYNVHYLDGLTARKRRGSCLEFSVGWPRNLGANQPPEWQPWRPVYEACKRGGHVASIHEYWPHEGPSYWAGWLCYRLVQWVPDYWADVPFIMTECGLDDAAAPGRPHKFWKDFMPSDPQAYVGQYAQYEWNCRSLRNRNGVQINILGYLIFTSDYGGSEWENADISTIHGLFVNMARTTHMPEPAAGHTLHLPALGGGVVTPPPPPVIIPPKTPPVTAAHPAADMTGWVIDTMCRIFGVDPILARAVIRVESGGRSFQGGRPIIRNELHIMRQNMANDALFDRHFRHSQVRKWEGHQWRRNEGDAWRDVHVNQEIEWEVFEFARSINSRAAHLALGMGAGQIMGFNYRIPGYDSPEQMLQSFSDPTWGGGNQVSAMFAYFYKVDGLIQDLQVADLASVARKYNGEGQVAYYVQRFQEEINALRRQGN